MAKSARRLKHLTEDTYLSPYLGIIEFRQARAAETEKKLTQGKTDLCDFASGHEFFGLHLSDEEWVLREWAPNATGISLVGDFNGWQESDQYRFTRAPEGGTWELRVPRGNISHGQLYKLLVYWAEGAGERIPSYARRVVQDPETLTFSAQVWKPDRPYQWRVADFRRRDCPPLIYEAHTGMAQEDERVGSYREFAEHIIPRIRQAGYNTIQLMAVMEHPYYGSFGYHVSSFFAASSRFGTPEDLKHLIDCAHEQDIAVIMDLVHSHAASNEVEGLAKFDGTDFQYFHTGEKGSHPAWGSRCFDYSKPEVLHFLLSNCRYWLDEFKVDGFRFDGITSMLYKHHGLGTVFDSYDKYFDSSVDDDALTYLYLANRLVHKIRPDAITVAEDVSGMPGLAAPTTHGGAGFNYRLAMGVPDFWFNLLRKVDDENWNMAHLWHELTNRRCDERTISYVESHDQAIVGDKTSIFLMLDSEMYTGMRADCSTPALDRGIALHKMMRLATAACAGDGYLNFMGNEFGHPEWIDFPREGNNWSYHYARRQWSLRDNPDLKYHFLADFDAAMTHLISEEDLIAGGHPRLLRLDEERKVLVFERSSCMFLFNFHPSESYPGYGFEVPSGKYELLLDSDAPNFGGHARVASKQVFEARETVEDRTHKHLLSVYLPSRSALVLRKTHKDKKRTP